ncbi:MAG: sugar-binding protein [Phycisphaerae bacterium]
MFSISPGSHRRGYHSISYFIALLISLLSCTGCQVPTAYKPAAEYPTFPPLRHAIKAVFGENGNDHGGDLHGRGMQFVKAFHDLGIDLTRIEFKWAIAEAQRGTYDWSEHDRLIDFLNRHGIEPMLMLYCAPTWAMRGTPGDEQLFIERGEQNLHSVVWPRREYLADFERFCETAARRYRGKARLFEFWNEPDGMAGPTVYHDRTGRAVDVRYGGDAKEYTLWLRHMYAAIKRGNPDAVVAAGSLCVHDTRFIEAMYASGCREHCDAISLHPYAGDGINVEWIRQCRAIMTRHGDWAKPVWLSEFGWDLGGQYDEKNGRWPDSAIRQAEIIIATAPVIQSLPYITHAFWFTLNDWSTGQTGINPVGTHRFGLLDMSGRRRPGFAALRDVVCKTSSLTRTAEMPSPQVVPPAGPIDQVSESHLKLTLTCRDPSPLFCPDRSEARPQSRALAFEVPGLTRGPHNIPVAYGGSGRGRPDGKVAWTTFGARADVIVPIEPAGGGRLLPNTYEAVASFGYGPQIRFPVTLPALARFADRMPRMDGQFEDWPSNWSIRDGRMKAEFAWTKTHLFFACAVRDPDHQQPHQGKDIWKGDCVQIAFDPLRDAVRGSQYDINDSEYALALTQDGAVIWRFICPPDGYVGPVVEARIAVRRADHETQYELAIPWSEVGVSDPATGRLVGVAIAACDSKDKERAVYRFGDGIIGQKQPYRFASIRLVQDLSR